MSSIIIIFIIAILAAILIDVVIIRRIAKKNRGRVASPQDVRIFGVYSPILTKVRLFILHFQSYLKNQGNATTQRSFSIDWKKFNPKTYLKNQWNAATHRSHSIEWGKLHRRLIGQDKLRLGVELLLILLWSLSFTLPYQNMDPYVIPSGNEYPSIIQAHHIWTNLLRCGSCFMWNGSSQGGVPAFVDPHSSMLHPIVVILTLIAGVRNGAKLALVATFILAGLAQWWLAYLLGLGRIPRVWSGMMAVVGGHLASRMELGLFGIILSTTCVFLVIPALIWVAQTSSRRAVALLGMCLASAALSGQGYLQVGLLFILPATILLTPWDQNNLKFLLKRLALAGLIGFLVASPFLVPYLHFLPEFGKQVNMDFKGVQSIQYIPLNLVIGNHDFYRTETLEKFPYPSIYESYIGWIPIILAVFALFGNRSSQEKRIVRFLFSVGVIATWVASAMPLKWLIDNIHLKQIVDMVAGIRHPSYIFGIAASVAIGLAAIGLDQIMHHKWPGVQIGFSSTETSESSIFFDTRWLMVIPLLFSLVDARRFSEVWIRTHKEDPVIQKVNKALLSPDLQWVNPPYGQHEYIESAVGMGMKMSSGTRAWFWKDREIPKPVREASFSGSPPEMIGYETISDVVLYKAAPGREYAQVIYSDETAPTICEAYGIWGDIDVSCNNPSPGTLVVKENSWSGWHVKLDAKLVPLERSDWLSLSLPPGEHEITFRYRPWDVPLGIALSLVGLCIAIILWVKKEPPILEKDSSNIESQSQEMSQ